MADSGSDATATITVTENGPYKVTGPVTIVDAAGNQVPIQGRAAYLCRCGGSQTKPFCDSTHSKVGFEAAERAVQALEAGQVES